MQSVINALKLSAIPRQAENEQGADTSSTFALTGEQIAQLRGMFKEEHDRDTTLTDGQITTLVEKTGDKELSPEEWAQAMLEVEDSVKDTQPAPAMTAEEAAKAAAVSNKVHGLAVEAGRKLAADTVVSDLIKQAIDEDENRSTRPLVLMREFRRVFGDDVKTFPVVGSDDKEAVKTNLPPDRYSYKAATGEQITGSFYRDLSGQVPAIASAMESAAKVRERIKAGQGTAKANAKELVKWDGRVENGVKNVRQAFRILQRLDILNSECGTLEAYHTFEYDTDKEGKRIKLADGTFQRVYDTSQKPICVGSTDPTERDKFNHYTVAQVLGAKVDKIKALGGGWTAWEAAMKKPAKDTNPIPAATLENASSFVSGVVHLLRGEGTKAAMRKIMDKASADADALISAWADLMDETVDLIDPYTTPRGGQPSRLSVIRARAKAAEAAEKAVKDKANAA